MLRRITKHESVRAPCGPGGGAGGSKRKSVCARCGSRRDRLLPQLGCAELRGNGGMWSIRQHRLLLKFQFCRGCSSVRSPGGAALLRG